MSEVAGKDSTGSRINSLDQFVEFLKELTAVRRKQLISHYYHLLEADSMPIGGSILSWDEISQMRQQGIRFGSHTHTHAILKCCTDEEIREELTLSKKILEDQIGEEIDLFCYPNARYKLENAALIKESGYKAAFRLHNLPVVRTDSPYFIPRVLINEITCKDEHYFKMKLLNMARR
jgi:peptidoglycan/xylan/chitin deacetylase (PgdA/CDA1 family)